ncbi:MAG TPA: polysaccharide deacetylase family protein [Myxococcaceae bacterium]|nr:polysaccharide deacetylase family protein [Myxococcaceae bacterium]
MRTACACLGLLVACTPPGKRLAETGHPTPEAAAKAEHDLATAVAPPAPPLPPVTPEVVAHGRRDRKEIALTFDACSTRDPSKYDARVTAELLAANAPATIFLGGSWAKEEVAQVKELASHPQFELGNHTYTHPHLPAVKDEARIRAELTRTQAEVRALTGHTPRFFRPPYGEYDQRVVRIAAELGLTTVEYDLPSGDPDAHATKERLVHWVLSQARPGSIVVMHINHMKFHTAEALPDIIAGLRQRGFTLVTVGQLVSELHPGVPAVGAAP